jgi:cystathionine beta-lyase/cystathionine gamma-synthase
VSKEVLAEAGIKNNLIRLSVGLESSEDLVADLLNALEAAELTGIPTPVAAVCA